MPGRKSKSSNGMTLGRIISSKRPKDISEYIVEGEKVKFLKWNSNVVKKRNLTIREINLLQKLLQKSIDSIDPQNDSIFVEYAGYLDFDDFFWTMYRDYKQESVCPIAPIVFHTHPHEDGAYPSHTDVYWALRCDKVMTSIIVVRDGYILLVKSPRYDFGIARPELCYHQKEGIEKIKGDFNKIAKKYKQKNLPKLVRLKNFRKDLLGHLEEEYGIIAKFYPKSKPPPIYQEAGAKDKIKHDDVIQKVR